MRSRLLLGIMLSGLLISCSSQLPRTNTDYLAKRTKRIPRGAAPILFWHAEKENVNTHWGPQDIRATVRGHVPVSRPPSDSRWEVDAGNAEGRVIPFLGILERHEGPIDPPVDLNQLPDGLYCALIPNVSSNLGKVSSVSPVLMLVEVRQHSFKEPRIFIPLIPSRKSPITPMPPSQ